MMPETRVQTLMGESTLEVTQTVIQKDSYKESDLLRQQAYFTEMIAKGQAGLDKVNALLNQLQNEKGVV
jgi:hypothetical protein